MNTFKNFCEENKSVINDLGKILSRKLFFLSKKKYKDLIKDTRNHDAYDNVRSVLTRSIKNKVTDYALSGFWFNEASGVGDDLLIATFNFVDHKNDFSIKLSYTFDKKESVHLLKATYLSYKTAISFVLSQDSFEFKVRKDVSHDTIFKFKERECNFYPISFSEEKSLDFVMDADNESLQKKNKKLVEFLVFCYDIEAIKQEYFYSIINDTLLLKKDILPEVKDLISLVSDKTCEILSENIGLDASISMKHFKKDNLLLKMTKKLLK